MRRAKIVCTLGPSSSTKEVVDALAAAGMDCARLNFSHGSREGHEQSCALVRDASARIRKPIALLGDLCGPKLRIQRFKHGKIQLQLGARFTLTTEEVTGDEQRVSVTYKPLPQDVKPGHAVLLSDGLIQLRVYETTETEVRTIVEAGGLLADNQGLHLPQAHLSAPALTDKDKEDLAFAVEKLQVDYIAVSFVRNAEDVKQAKKLAGSTPIIAKIEKPEAVERLCDIIDVADGVMIARGDLGVELRPEKIPLIQKQIIREVAVRGKCVITATQMLDSMIRNPRPTRAEVADVANAILDGTDAVMLSGETAAGLYPVESVKMMDAIVREVESAWLRDEAGVRAHYADVPRQWGFESAASHAAALLSSVLPLKALVVFTVDGRSARFLSSSRPKAPIVAITADPKIARRHSLDWGVTSYVEVPPEDLEEILRLSTALLVRERLCRKGDPFAMVLGWPISSPTNTVKLHRL